MRRELYGVVDLGSNTGHLLVAASDGQRLAPRLDTSVALALGQEVDRHGRVGAAKLTEVVATVRAFQHQAQSAGVSQLYLLGTQALRAAANHDQVSQALSQATGLHLDLLPPAAEAALAFEGVAVSRGPAAGSRVVVDIGGGSLQVAVGQGRALWTSRSWPLGAARLARQFLGADPPAGVEVRRLRAYLAGVLTSELPMGGGPVAEVVGTGGTLRRLPRLLGHRRGTVLLGDSLDTARRRLLEHPAPLLAKRYDLKPERVRMLLPAVLALQEVVAAYGDPPLLVVPTGIREGAILRLARGVPVTETIQFRGLDVQACQNSIGVTITFGKNSTLKDYIP